MTQDTSNDAALAASPWLRVTELPGSAITVRPRVGAEIAETRERRAVINLLDYILDLFRDEGLSFDNLPRSSVGCGVPEVV